MHNTDFLFYAECFFKLACCFSWPSSPSCLSHIRIEALMWTLMAGRNLKVADISGIYESAYILAANGKESVTH